MNTNMTGFVGFQNSLHPCALDESSLSIGRVNSCEKQPDNFLQIILVKAELRNYLKNC